MKNKIKMTYYSTSHVMQFLLKSFFLIRMHHHLLNHFLLAILVIKIFFAIMNFFIYKFLTFLIISSG